MRALQESIQQFFASWDFTNLPSIASISESMDTIAWILAAMMVAAVGLGIYYGFGTRRTFPTVDDVDVNPRVLLKQLKRDPTLLPPSAILRKLGAESTLALLEYGDQTDDKEWRFRWGSIRTELLDLLSSQNAFGPIHALARYYRSENKDEPDTIRIRRTALIHKLGVTRHLSPNSDGLPTELRIRCHPAEVVGDLGFNGTAVWLMPDEPASATRGPLIEMEPIEFRTLSEVELNLHVRRTPTEGGGFRIQLNKRRDMWVVTHEEMEWAS